MLFRWLGWFSSRAWRVLESERARNISQRMCVLETDLTVQQVGPKLSTIWFVVEETLPKERKSRQINLYSTSYLALPMPVSSFLPLWTLNHPSIPN